MLKANEYTMRSSSFTPRDSKKLSLVLAGLVQICLFTAIEASAQKGDQSLETTKEVTNVEPDATNPPREQSAEQNERAKQNENADEQSHSKTDKLSEEGANTQEQKKTESKETNLFSLSNIERAHLDHGGFGAPELKVTGFDGNTGILIGGKGAWILHHLFFLGGAGYGVVNSPDLKDEIKLGMGYGGVLIGFVIGSQYIVHGLVSVLVGAGGVDLDSSNTDIDDSPVGFFLLEPSVELEFNVARIFRLSVGASYRYVNNSPEGIDANDIRGFSFVCATKFGWF